MEREGEGDQGRGGAEREDTERGLREVDEEEGKRREGERKLKSGDEYYLAAPPPSY